MANFVHSGPNDLALSDAARRAQATLEFREYIERRDTCDPSAPMIAIKVMSS